MAGTSIIFEVDSISYMFGSKTKTKTKGRVRACNCQVCVIEHLGTRCPAAEDQPLPAATSAQAFTH